MFVLQLFYSCSLVFTQNNIFQFLIIFKLLAHSLSTTPRSPDRGEANQKAFPLEVTTFASSFVAGVDVHCGQKENKLARMQPGTMFRLLAVQRKNSNLSTRCALRGFGVDLTGAGREERREHQGIGAQVL